MATGAQKIPRLAPAMAAITTLPRALARRHARTLSLKDTSRFAPDNDGQYWPKTNSPEWLALQKRPSSGGPIGPRAPRDGGSRSFFGIPADDAPPVRSPVEEGWLEQRRKASIEERAREKAAEARFDKIQATNGATPPGSPSALARPHPLARPPPSPRLERMRGFKMTPAEINSRSVCLEGPPRSVCSPVSGPSRASSKGSPATATATHSTELVAARVQA